MLSKERAQVTVPSLFFYVASRKIIPKSFRKLFRFPKNHSVFAQIIPLIIPNHSALTQKFGGGFSYM